MGYVKPAEKPCRNAKRYKGMRRPHCSGGAGCSACIEKWIARTKWTPPSSESSRA